LKFFGTTLATPPCSPINGVILPVPWGNQTVFFRLMLQRSACGEESVKASHFMLLKRYQYMLIQTHGLHWIVEFAVEVGFILILLNYPHGFL